MTTRIRLTRGGAKKNPHYRVVVINSRAPRDGEYIEKVGTYHPRLTKDNENRVRLDKERISYWLSEGAQPSETVIKFIENAGIELPKKLKLEVEKKKKLRKPKAPKKDSEAAA